MTQKGPSKKVQERAIMTKFLKVSGLTDEINSFKQGEKPDFRIYHNKNHISIELTSVTDSTNKKRESMQQRIILLAHQKFQARRNDQLRVLVQFTTAEVEYTNKFCDQIANEIAGFVDTIWRDREGEHFFYETDNRKYFNKYIRGLSIDNRLNFDTWEKSGAHKVDKIDEGWLQEMIVRKQQLIEQYQERFDEHWLVFVAGLGYKSTAYRFDLMNEIYTSFQFEKIFVLDYFPSEVIELK